MLVNATSLDFVICGAATTTAERPQTTVLFFSGLLARRPRRQQRDLGDLDLVGVRRQRRDPDQVVAVAPAVRVEREALLGLRDAAAADARPIGAEGLGGGPAGRGIEPGAPAGLALDLHPGGVDVGLRVDVDTDAGPLA